MADEKVVNKEPIDQVPSALEQAIASSPEVTEQQVPETEPSTPKEEVIQEEQVQQEEQRVPYTRFKDVVDEKNYYKQMLDKALSQQPQPQIQQPTQDPYQGMTAEEEKFWRAVDARASKIAEEKVRQVTPVIDAGRMELAQIKVQQFRNQHPDIRPNSQEEMEIASRISIGYTPDDAYWAVTGPKGMRIAERKAEQQVKQKIEAKKLANVENSPSVNTQNVSQQEKRPVPKTPLERQRMKSESIDRFARDFLKNFEANP